MRVHALLCVNSNHSGRSRKRSSESQFSSLFFFLFWVFEGDPHQSPGPGRSRLHAAGPDETNPAVSMSNPGTTRGTKLSVLHAIFFPCLVNRGFFQTKIACASSFGCTSPLPPLWRPGIFAESPVQLSSNPFCSACALMLQN